MAMSEFWNGRRVLLTGHTGFKGSWLSLWLTLMGAKVSGFALEPDTEPAIFDQMKLSDDIDHMIGDIRDHKTVLERVLDVQPEVVIHLAAQPLVQASYCEPVATWNTNVSGTIHLLEALRRIEHRCSVVMVTTDKVYDNQEWVFPYRETDRLGGRDPYSASKAAMEIALRSWRSSFLTDGNIRMASVRSGNVLGGGDWAENRLVPDIIRALQNDEDVRIRNPNSVRPWQHVLEPLGAYIRLAEKLWSDSHALFETGYNIGPETSELNTVQTLVETVFRLWPGRMIVEPDTVLGHEAALLSLSIEKARSELQFKPRWNFEETVHNTVEWYQAVNRGASARVVSIAQIESYGAP